MLITKLRDYALANGLVDDPLFEMKAVNFQLSLDRDGNAVSIASLEDGKRGVQRRVPKKVGGNAGGVATFGTDNARFVLGLVDDPAQESKAARDLAAFASLIATAASEGPAESGLQAAAAFYADPARVEAARTEAREKGVKEASRVALSAFADGGIDLANSDAGQAFWRRYRLHQEAAKPKGDAVLCLSCGEPRPAVATNDTKIMGLLGGQPSGTALVSFDKEAFRSHGWDQNANAAVCEACSQAYTRGLNHLLLRDNIPRTRIDEAGTTFVLWAEGDPGATSLLDLVEAPDSETAGKILAAPRTGVLPSGGVDARLYVLGLRGNGGRAVVVEWFDVALKDAYENVRLWFADLQIGLIFDQFHTTRDAITKEKERVLVAQAGELARPMSRWVYCRATARDFDSISPQLPVAILRAALTGGILPLSVAEACIRRLQLDGFGDYFAPARVGLIRCVLNRMNPNERQLGTMLDPTTNDQPYVCGRLLATLEAVQYQGVGDVGANVIDRFYGRASTAPRLVFGQLLVLAQSHLGAIDNAGSRINLDRELQDIIDLLEPQFPATLSPEEQGRFAIGYWHQKANRFANIRRNREERAASANATTTPETQE